MATDNKEVTYNITKRIAVLSEKANGYSKQLNMVSWNGRDAKLDIREWSPEGRASKGVTLSEEEGCLLLDALAKVYSEIE